MIQDFETLWKQYFLTDSMKSVAGLKTCGWLNSRKKLKVKYCLVFVDMFLNCVEVFPSSGKDTDAVAKTKK